MDGHKSTTSRRRKWKDGGGGGWGKEGRYKVQITIKSNIDFVNGRR